jgi:hypothetical protein
MSFTIKAIDAGQYVLIEHEGPLTREQFEEARAVARIILDEHRWNKLLVDLRGMVARMPIVDVYYVMESNRKILPYIKIALVFSQNLEEEGRFAQNVAENRGIHLRAFVDVKKAEAWLLDSRLCF